MIVAVDFLTVHIVPIGWGNDRHVLGAKPFTEPLLTYCQLDCAEQILLKFWWKYTHFLPQNCIWKCRLRNVGCLVPECAWMYHVCFDISNCDCLTTRFKVTVRPLNLNWECRLRNFGHFVNASICSSICYDVRCCLFMSSQQRKCDKLIWELTGCIHTRLGNAAACSPQQCVNQFKFDTGEEILCFLSPLPTGPCGRISPWMTSKSQLIY